MFARLREDMAVVFDRDPAARSRWEVLTCYPGLHALVWHRGVAHPLWRAGLRWLARWLAHWGRWLTGIEIHPGRDHRPARVHRPRHGGGDRRNGRDRRRLHALSRGHAGRDVLEQGQAPSDAGARRGDRGRAPRSSGRSWSATAPRSAPTRSSCATCRRAPPPSASRRGSSTAEDQQRREAQAAKIGFSAYAIAADMNDPMVQAIHQLLDHAAATDERFNRLVAQLQRDGVDCGDAKAIGRGLRPAADQQNA